MWSNLKQLIKGKKALQFSLKPLSLEWRLYEPDELRKLVMQLHHHGVDCVYDIGANKGQFARGIIDAGYKGKIVSFEPLAEAHAILEKNASAYSNWIVAQRCAVGASPGQTTINISENSQSSSILQISQQALAGAPKAKFKGKEEINVITLDSAADLTGGSPSFIKVDTQGFELEVLKGASELLKITRGVQLEVSFAPMYEGAPDFETLYRFMLERGFEVWGMDTAFRDPKTRRVYQVDATFFRTA